MNRVDRWAILGQGLYYVATGVWPLVSLRTFEAVTGPKVDDWLVEMVGALATVIGLALLVAARRPPLSAEARFLGLGSALAFAAVEVFSVVQGRIWRIYLADAAVEAVIAVGLVAGWMTARRAS